MKQLIEQLARTSTEKEAMEDRMREERRQFTLLLDKLKKQHHKVVKEKKEVLFVLVGWKDGQSVGYYMYIHKCPHPPAPGLSIRLLWGRGGGTFVQIDHLTRLHVHQYNHCLSLISPHAVSQSSR